MSFFDVCCSLCSLLLCYPTSLRRLVGWFIYIHINEFPTKYTTMLVRFPHGTILIVWLTNDFSQSEIQSWLFTVRTSVQKPPTALRDTLHRACNFHLYSYKWISNRRPLFWVAKKCGKVTLRRHGWEKISFFRKK